MVQVKQMLAFGRAVQKWVGVKGNRKELGLKAAIDMGQDITLPCKSGIKAGEPPSWLKSTLK